MIYNITNKSDQEVDDELFRLESLVDHSNYYNFQHVFSKEEVDKIISENDPHTFRATTFSGTNDDFRKSNIKWINRFENDLDNTWIFQKISELAVIANQNIYHFLLCGMFEGIQYTVYDGSEDGFYCSHVDHGKNYYKRKLSIVIQLSDPSEYEGGDLLLHTRNKPFAIPKGLGSCITFPSWMLHEVTPVTSGIRRTLVCWVSGPPFK